jgi:hypothetical protein
MVSEAHWQERPPGWLSPASSPGPLVPFPGSTHTAARASRVHLEALVADTASVQVSRVHLEVLVANRIDYTGTSTGTVTISGTAAGVLGLRTGASQTLTISRSAAGVLGLQTGASRIAHHQPHRCRCTWVCELVQVRP